MADHRKFLDELISSEDVVQMKDASGNTDASITVATDFPGRSQTKSLTMSYIVPAGYVRQSANFETSHASGDSAHSDWANGDPQNGDVFLSVHCSGVGGKARAAVNNAFAVRISMLAKLAEMEAKELESKK